jgi:hypothetical protein
MVGHGFENLWKRKRSKDQGGGKKHGWEKGSRYGWQLWLWNEKKNKK